MVSQLDKCIAFKELHEGNECFFIPNPWDAGSARLLEGMGFKALATTSQGYALTLGKHDGRVTLEEKLKHCREVVEATPLPLSADLEKGFGDSPESVQETIRAAAETGLAGCSIEDHTGDKNDPIYEFSAALERIRLQRAENDRERMRRQLEIASEIQRTFLPSTFPDLEGVSGAVVLGRQDEDLARRTVYPCIKCGDCLDACPLHLRQNLH